MRLLPIVERELRVAARRHSTHVARLVVALVGMLVGLFFLCGAFAEAAKAGSEQTLFSIF